VCRRNGFNLHEIHFYTGIPSTKDNPFWNKFWSAKLLAMSRAGIKTFSRPLRYRKKTVQISPGIEYSVTVGEEKGVDVRMAIDIMRMVRQNLLDVALLFSQDQDFTEVADEVRAVARAQGRWIKMASAFPFSPTAINKRGINKTDWIPIDRTLYDACIDKRDYRPTPRPSSGH
jgi:uncharacterized LabA/DUF88 family protein